MIVVRALAKHSRKTAAVDLSRARRLLDRPR